MKKYFYWAINSLIILLSAGIFVFAYKGFGLFDSGMIFKHATISFVIAFSVHFIKAIRLYGALYGNNMSFSTHIKQYCKTVPISIILPYKIGDIFRMYCYGYNISNYFKGVIIVLFDRFIDTLALVSMIFIINIISGTEFTILFYILLIFLILLIVFYMVFPSTYRYWNRYFISCNASANKNRILKLLKKLNEAYSEVVSVIKGRWMMMYVLSILAWIAEIGGTLILGNMYGESISVAFVSDYLFAALNGMNSVYLRQFVSMSVILLLGTYVVFYVVNIFNVRKNKV